MPGGLQVTTPDLVTSAFFEAITPSDDTVLENVRALVIGGAGDLVLTNSNGDDVTFTVVAGQTLVVSPAHVKAATTATVIVALY